MDREMPEGVREEVGACRFCGQIQMFHNVSLSPEELNDAATEACSCHEAQEYFKNKKRASKLQSEIYRIFETDECLKMVLCDLIPLFLDGSLNSIKIKTITGTEAVLKIGSKGEIKAERKRIAKQSTEG